MGEQIVAAKIDIDPELIPGARNAVRVCLQLKPTERVTIITDETTSDIAAALRSEVEQIGSECSVFTLEHHARRPLKFMPDEISGTRLPSGRRNPGQPVVARQSTDAIHPHTALDEPLDEEIAES